MTACLLSGYSHIYVHADGEDSRTKLVYRVTASGTEHWFKKGGGSLPGAINGLGYFSFTTNFKNIDGPDKPIKLGDWLEATAVGADIPRVGWLTYGIFHAGELRWSQASTFGGFNVFVGGGAIQVHADDVTTSGPYKELSK